jgi:hypothetical protein
MYVCMYVLSYEVKNKKYIVLKNSVYNHDDLTISSNVLEKLSITYVKIVIIFFAV